MTLKKNIITSHKELAQVIQSKSILLLNSLGKDAALCLEWLAYFAKPKKIVSLHFKLANAFPTDELYKNYFMRRYPMVEFIEAPALVDISDISQGQFQTPITINYACNNLEFEEFSIAKSAEEYRRKLNIDLICEGISCYEGMGRAMYLRRVGLLDEKKHKIYPIGLMKQKQVIELIKLTKVKLNPSYKFAESSFDTPSYFKMRMGFLAKPEFKEIVYKNYPLLALDEYRYIKLFGM